MGLEEENMSVERKMERGGEDQGKREWKGVLEGKWDGEKWQ